jgi:opacity protein-like surface antigen
MKTFALTAIPAALLCLAAPLPASADENLLGYVSGAETLPQGASEAYAWLTHRWDKGQGTYSAYDSELEYEYGVTSRFTASVALLGQSIDTKGLVIDAYMPGAESYGMKPSGIELKGKYNFLSPAMEPVGLSAMFELHQSWLDPHSGLDKDTTSFDVSMQLQKYFLDDQLVAVANAGFEGTYAKRAPLDAATQASADAAMQALTSDPSATFEWPTKPEMEIEFTLGAGLSYRVAPNWNIGVETQYQTEFETEVGQERWSWFAGPSIHYGGKQWWATLTWFNQLAGGREQYINQADDDLHLIEKTKNELRLKLGYNF